MSDATKTVTVACKIPNGIFMQAYKMEEVQEPILGGGTRVAKRAAPASAKIKIAGNGSPQGVSNVNVVEGGYALTRHVPAEVARSWMEANKDSAMVKNGLVFVHERAENATAQSKDGGKVMSGLERLDVTFQRKNDGTQVPNDPRWPRSRNLNITAPMTDAR